MEKDYSNPVKGIISGVGFSKHDQELIDLKNEDRR